MDLTAFMVLWLAFLQVHQFDSSLAPEATWICKHDNQKILHLYTFTSLTLSHEYRAELIDHDKIWMIAFTSPSSIAAYGPSKMGDLGEMGTPIIFDGFDPKFERWLYDTFTLIRCNPDEDFYYFPSLAVKTLKAQTFFKILMTASELAQF